MNINNLWIVITVVAIFSLFFGYGFGWLEWGRKLKNLEDEQKPADSPDRLMERVVELPPVAAPPAKPAEPYLLSLQEVDGRLSIELEGSILNMDTISTDQRKRLIELVTRLRPWLEGRVAPIAPLPEPLLMPVPAPTSTRPASTSKKKEEIAAPLSMLAQIDEILQKNMAGTPLEKMGIKLQETPGGGVTVAVGLKRYTDVNKVPDPEVQTAIRAAIAEWEKKFTPG